MTPEIQVIAPDYINEAYERVLASDVRYRFVIEPQACEAGRCSAQTGPTCGQFDEDLAD